jgi:hypothetical protein
VYSLAPYDSYIVSVECWVDSLNNATFALTSNEYSCRVLLGGEKPSTGLLSYFYFCVIFIFIFSFLFLNKSLREKIKSCNLKGFCWLHWEYNSSTEALMVLCKKLFHFKSRKNDEIYEIYVRVD